MAIKKKIEIEVSTRGAQKELKDLGAIIQEQKDITLEFERELQKLEEQLKDTSKTNLSQQKSIKDRIDVLKSSIKDQKLSIRELTNEKKKQIKVDELTIDSATRNYGAVQLLDQVTGGYASKVRSAVDASKLFNTSLKATRGALIATGIGAFVVALGVVVAYWDDIKELITGANAQLERQNELLKSQLDLNETQLKTLQTTRDLQILEGKNTAEINRLIAEKLALIQSENLELIDGLKVKLANAKAVEAEASWWEKILYLRSPIGRAQADKKAKDEHALEIDSLEKELELLIQKDEQLKITQFNEANPPKTTTKNVSSSRSKVSSVGDVDTFAEAEKRKADAVREGTADFLSAQQERLDAEILAIQDQADSETLINYRKNQILAEQNEQAAKDEIARKKIVEQTSIGLASSTFTTINALSEESSTLGKATAAAQALINTYQGITAELATKTATPLGFALKVANIAAVSAIGFKSVKDILSTTPQNVSAGGSVGSNSGSRGGASAPSFNLVAGTGSNQIAEGLAQQPTPLKAYVVSSEVTTAQSLDKNIIQNAGF